MRLPPAAPVFFSFFFGPLPALQQAAWVLLSNPCNHPLLPLPYFFCLDSFLCVHCKRKAYALCSTVPAFACRPALDRAQHGCMCATQTQHICPAQHSACIRLQHSPQAEYAWVHCVHCRSNMCTLRSSVPALQSRLHHSPEAGSALCATCAMQNPTCKPCATQACLHLAASACI